MAPGAGLTRGAGLVRTWARSTRSAVAAWLHPRPFRQRSADFQPAHSRKEDDQMHVGQEPGVGKTAGVRVLVVEDDRELAEAIGLGLRREQMAVDLAFDGEVGLERALIHGYDVVVLDRDLPRTHGDDVCAHLVRQGCRSRVLMLTAAATIEERVDGLGLGADDYLPKPFAFAELVARIRALFRRDKPALPPVLESEGLQLDPAQRRA